MNTFRTNFLNKIFTVCTLALTLTTTQSLQGMQEENNFFEKFERVHIIEKEPGLIKSMVSKDNFIFILFSTGSIDIFDISKPTNPCLIKTLKLDQEEGEDDIDTLIIGHSPLFVCDELSKCDNLWGCKDSYIKASWIIDIKKNTVNQLVSDLYMHKYISSPRLAPTLNIFASNIDNNRYWQESNQKKGHITYSSPEVVWEAHETSIIFLAYDSIKKHLISASNHEIKIWNVKKTTKPICLQTINMPEHTITSLTLTKKVLVFALKDGTIEFWRQSQDTFFSNNYKNLYTEYVENNESDLAKFYFEFDD